MLVTFRLLYAVQCKLRVIEHLPLSRADWGEHAVICLRYYYIQYLFHVITHAFARA